MTRYAVVNQSTLVSDADACTAWLAVKNQLYYQVAPAWERKFMDSVFVHSSGSIPDDAYPIYILDNADVANDLGYHSEDPNGKAYGRVFVEPILQNSGTILSGTLSVSTVLSHEVIEFFIDKHCQLWADRNDGTMVAYEACDPVESNSYEVHAQSPTGEIVLVSVSNFVLDAWFDVNSTQVGTKYDWMGVCSAPFQLSKGGYQVIIDVKSGQTSQVFANYDAQMLRNAIKPLHAASRVIKRSNSLGL